MKILIVKLSALGDVLQVLPALNLLKKIYPQAEIDWLVEERNAELLINHPWLKRVLLFNKEFFKKPKVFYNFVRELRKTSYEAILDFQGLLKSGIFVFLAKARYKMGFRNHREGSPLFYNVKFPPYDPNLHAVKRYLDLVIKSAKFLTQDVSIPEFNSKILYEIPLPERKPPFSPSKPFILLIAGARWETKLWPFENWKSFLEIAGDLRKKITFYFIGAPTEKELKAFAEEAEKNYQGVFSLVGKLSLKELVFLMKEAEVVLSVDTGTMHLASLLNKPILALFGPTSPERTGPWSELSIVLRESLACSPCFKRTCKNPLCMKNLSPERVKRELIHLLGKKFSSIS